MNKKNMLTFGILLTSLVTPLSLSLKKLAFNANLNNKTLTNDPQFQNMKEELKKALKLDREKYSQNPDVKHHNGRAEKTYKKLLMEHCFTARRGLQIKMPVMWDSFDFGKKQFEECRTKLKTAYTKAFYENQQERMEQYNQENKNS